MTVLFTGEQPNRDGEGIKYQITDTPQGRSVVRQIESEVPDIRGLTSGNFKKGLEAVLVPPSDFFRALADGLTWICGQALYLTVCDWLLTAAGITGLALALSTALLCLHVGILATLAIKTGDGYVLYRCVLLILAFGVLLV